MASAAAMTPVAYQPDDGLHVRLRHSKTDQEGDGQVTALPFTDDPGVCPVCAVLQWMSVVQAWEQRGRAGIIRVLRSPDHDPAVGHICELNHPTGDGHQLGDRSGGPGITTSDASLLRAVHRSGNLRDGGLSGHSINTVVQRWAEEAGLDAGRVANMGGHSLRTGLVTEAYRAGAVAEEIARQTGPPVLVGVGQLPARTRTPCGECGQPAVRPAASDQAGRGQHDHRYWWQWQSRRRRHEYQLMVEYGGEWALFVDLCAATGQSALPASPETVLQYLDEEQPTGGTAGRWIAAIRTAHVQAGEPDPCAGPVTIWVRRARNGLSTDPETVAAELAGPARQVPTTGWPTGIFGRRDRLAFLLHHLAAIPACQLVNLRTDDLTVTDRRKTEVKAGETAGWVAESPKEPAVLCLACAVLRWWWVLSQVDRGAYREMATSINKAPPRSDHVCANSSSLTAKLQVPAGWPVFPAIDRWGNVASEPVPAMSVTGMETVLRDVAGRRWAHATVRVPALVGNAGESQPVVAPGAGTAVAAAGGPGWGRRSRSGPGIAGRDSRPVGRGGHRH